MQAAAPPPRGTRLPLRARLAAASGGVVASVSRLLGAGDGTVIGGRVSLTMDPLLLERLAQGHEIALVTGTNGKTTTNRLLGAALATAGPVVANSDGSNLPSGLVTALCGRSGEFRASLEVDEAYLGQVAHTTSPKAILLLNLSRDQLDRISEVRMLAARWHSALASLSRSHVVANADDPIVAWAASAGRRVTWVAAGQPWRSDSTGCPRCEGRIDFEGQVWSCASCGLARPDPGAWLDGDAMVGTDGGKHEFGLALPGWFNRANAMMAAVGAATMGVPTDRGLAAMASTTDVSGRYQSVTVDGVVARLLLAKNPAGWVAVFDLLHPEPGPVVVAINARVADGRDPSWLWDVPFERLRGRPTMASGERAADLAVRLGYAEVDHEIVHDPLEALRRVGSGKVDFVGNYTAFQDLRSALRRSSR